MTAQRPLPFTGGILLFGAILLAGTGRVGAAAFVIDSSQSRITLSGKVEGFAFMAQGPGGLTAAYTGNINAMVSSSTIQFTGSSTISAITNGVWQPAAGGAAGSAPADYGAKATIPLIGTGYGAGRNIVLDVTSASLALAQTNFDSSQLVLSAATNANPAFDYRLALQGGSISLSGNFTNSIATGSFISTNGSSLQLVIQINTTLSGTNNSTLTLTGQIVATNSLSVFAAPVITGLVITNQNLVLTVSNVTAQSRLLSSTDLTAWTPANATLTTNGTFINFTTPMSGPYRFFRVQQ